MAGKEKKVDLKDVAKIEVMGIITKALEEAGIAVVDGGKFGFTKHTIVARLGTCDIQVKAIAPKTGTERYKEEEVGE